MQPLRTSVSQQKKQPKVVRKPATTLSLIECIEQVVDIAENSKLSQAFFKEVKPYSQKIAHAFQITDTQAVLFSLFIDQFHSSSIDIDDISKLVDCRPLHILKYNKDIHELEKRKFIFSTNRGERMTQYKIPKTVLDALKNNQPYQPKIYKNITLPELMDILEDFFETTCRELEKESIEKGFSEIENILAENLHLPFIQKIRNSELDGVHLFVFLYFCHACVNQFDDEVRVRDFEDYLDKHNLRRIKADFSKNKGFLLEKEFIQAVPNSGFLGGDEFCLTTKAKEEFLTTLDIKIDKKKDKRKEIIEYSNIALKPLFYNEKESQQIKTLSTLLEEKNFLNITQRLSSSGFRKGFAALFYGFPGTGKTETVMQIARQTKRNIFWVDISETKSMWFGESEKRIKAIFDNYKKLVQKHTLAPILLFNEADAIISKRKTNSTHSIDQTENTIQNIILQEMENLEGIMIATTNLTENLDKAFERRFLYKIQFEKPDILIKQKIWENMIPEMQEKEYTILAKNYDFSGGEIENIVRKKAVQEVLIGEKLSFVDIQQYCEEEIIFSQPKYQKIGFHK